jgi:hypothetical protein
MTKWSWNLVTFTFMLFLYVFEVWNVTLIAMHIQSNSLSFSSEVFVFGIAVTQWHSRLVVECNEVDGFHLPAVTYAADDTEESISQNDLLLLSKENVNAI